MRIISDEEGLTALRQWQRSNENCPRPQLATAVRWTLAQLARILPGRAVEVRVPPFGAVQVLGGTTHRRGTPPAVVEMDPQIWLQLATGGRTWTQCEADGQLQASGERANLARYLPIL